MRTPSMPLRLLALVALGACARKISGPVPTLSGTSNQVDPARRPAVVCNAEGDAQAGWMVDALGSSFSPLPLGTLHPGASVQMPDVTLSGPEAYTVPPDRVHFADATDLPLSLPTRDTATDAHQLAPGSYALTVTNPNGNAATLASALTVVPPPVESTVTISGSGGAQGATFCADQPQTLVITGSGFRTDAAPKVSFLPVGGGAAVPAPAVSTPLSSASVTVALPAGFFGSQATAAGSLYTVQVQNADGCRAPYGADPAGLGKTQITVFSSCKKLGTLSLTPRFGWQQQNQPVTVLNQFSAPATNGFSGAAPQISILATLVSDPAGTAPHPIPLRRVAYSDPNTVTAVVPTCSGVSATPASSSSPCPNGIAPGGPYDLLVVDPQSGSGTLTAAFTVVAQQPPSFPKPVGTLAPSSITVSGANVTVSGAAFDSAGVNPATASVLLGNQCTSASPCTTAAGSVTAGVVFCPLALASGSGNALTVTVPSSLPATGCYVEDPSGNRTPSTAGFALTPGLYLVRVQHANDVASTDYSGLTVTGSSYNPIDKGLASSSLNVPRADHGVTVGYDDLGGAFLYAAGGLDGSGNQLASVEAAPVLPFGDLGGICSSPGVCKFRQQANALPTPRNGVQLVARRVPGDTTYLFAIGGRGLTGPGAGTQTALTDVLRAQVLRNADAPVITGSTVGAGTLPAGSYYYRVAARLPPAPGNTINPGGETLPSDEETVTLTQAGGATITWSCAAASAVPTYRIYRTPTANAKSGSEVHIADVANACASGSQSYADTGGAAIDAATPLPPGSIGPWVAMSPLVAGRFRHQARLVGDAIFVAGGCGSGGGCAAAGDLASVEKAALVACGGSGCGAGNATPAAFASAGALGTAREAFSLVVVDANSGSINTSGGSTVTGGPYLLAVGGVSNGPEITGSATVERGDSTAAPITFTGVGPTNIGRGGWAEATANQLFSEQTKGAGQLWFESGFLCGSSSCTVSSVTNLTPGFNNTGGVSYADGGDRYLLGENLLRAYVYAVGGFASPSTLTPVGTVDLVIY